MITIGDAVIWLRSNSSKLDGDLNQAEQKTKGTIGRISSSIKESMTFALGQIAAQGLNQLAAGIENLAKDVIDLGMEYTQQVEEMSRLTGASAEDASRMIQVADDMRLSYSDVSTALKMYVKTQQDAGSAAKVNIDSLAMLSDQYLKLAPGVDRANFLLANFGRSGLEMGKLMEQGGAAIRDMSAGVDESLIVTQEGIDSAREYEKAMDDWNDAIMGVKLTLFKELQPYLDKFAQWLKDDGIKYLREFITWFSGLPEPVKAGIFALGGLLVLLIKLGPALYGIAGLVSMLGGGGAAAGAAGAGGGLFAGLAAAIGAVGAPVILLTFLIGVLIGVIIKAWPILSKLGDQWLQIVAASFKRIGFEIDKFVKTYVDHIKRVASLSLKEWAEVGKAIVNGIWNGIKGWWEWLKSGVSGLLNGLLGTTQDKLQAHSPSRVWAAQVGGPMAQGIGMGFEEALRGQVQATINASVSGLAGSSRAAAQSISVGTLVVDSRLSQREHNYWDERSERIAERTTLKWLRKGGI